MQMMIGTPSGTMNRVFGISPAGLAGRFDGTPFLSRQQQSSVKQAACEQRARGQIARAQADIPVRGTTSPGDPGGEEKAEMRAEELRLLKAEIDGALFNSRNGKQQ